MSDKIYNHTEMTEITQYNVENADTFMGWKKYSPVFHWLQPKPGGVTELHEGYVEIGWPTDTPRDTEDYDDLILAQSWQERPVHPDSISIYPTSWELELGDPITDSKKFTYIVTPSWSEFPVTWSSWDKISVTSEWVVTPVALWEWIELRVSSWAVYSTASIDVVKVAVTWVSLKKDWETVTSLTLTEWDTADIEIAISPSNALYKSVTLLSSDENVATIEAWSTAWTAVITAVAAWDPVTITVTSTDDTSKKATCTVTVNAPVTEPETPEPETPSEEPGE